jgi:hypothetical protein
MTVFKLPEELGLTGFGIKVFEDINSKQQQAATDTQGTMKMLACCDEVLKENKRSCVTRLQCLISSSHLQGLVHHHLDCWTMVMMILMTRVQFKRKSLLLKLSFVLSAFIF